MTVFRISAILLLFLACGELLACAAVPAAGCELDGTDAAGSHCLCCCRHAVPPTPLVPASFRPVAFAAPPPETLPPSSVSPPVYHPPRD